MAIETEEGSVSVALSTVWEEEAESKPYRSLGRRDVLETWEQSLKGTWTSPARVKTAVLLTSFLL